MKAIETIYNGYKFRSRLEARWAVFFDALGIEYKYEAEGFDLDGVWYLPDFWLPDLDCWVEIKGQELTDEEKNKAVKLCAHSGKRVHIFYDCWFVAGTSFYIALQRKDHSLYKDVLQSIIDEYDKIFEHYRSLPNFFAENEVIVGMYSSWWQYTPKRGAMPFPYMGHINTSISTPITDAITVLQEQAIHPKIEAAFAAARQARFEHQAG